jgi:hypothetical protein
MRNPRTFTLRLNGNILDRLRCCFVLLFYPDSFVRGLMESCALATANAVALAYANSIQSDTTPLEENIRA